MLIPFLKLSQTETAEPAELTATSEAIKATITARPFRMRSPLVALTTNATSLSAGANAAYGPNGL